LTNQNECQPETQTEGNQPIRETWQSEPETTPTPENQVNEKAENSETCWLRTETTELSQGTHELSRQTYELSQETLRLSQQTNFYTGLPNGLH
jgi:hypothetical protein